MRYIIKGFYIQYVLYIMVAVSIGLLSTINPILTAFMTSALAIIILCLRHQKWIIIGLILGIFVNFPLPIYLQIVNTDEKVIILLFIAVTLLSIPIMWKRTALIRGWWGLAALSIVSLIATSIAVKNENGATFVMSHLYGAESIVVFFLFSLYTYSFIKTKKDFDIIINKLPIVLLIGLMIRAASISIGTLSLGALNKNTFGFLLDLIIPLSWVAIQLKRDRSWIVLFIFSLVLLVLNNSRGAVIGIGFTIVYFLIFFKKHSKRTIFTYLFFIITIICAIPFIPSSIIQRLLSVANMQDYTQMSRLLIWSASLQIIKLHPILGIGFYNFNYYLQNYFPSYIIFLHPHNSYLNVLVSTGFVGLLFFLLTARYILSSVLVGMKKSKHEIQWYFSGLLLGIIALSVHGLFDSTFFMPETFVLFGGLFGLALRGTALIHEESSNSDDA